jgi:O-antigen/teichoic acid export membrane protein
MSRRRTAAWNAVFGYAQIGVTIARNVLLVPLYLRFIDVAEYGAWLATGGVLAQLFVSDFGLTATVIQRAATAFGRGDRQLVGSSVGSGLSVSILLAVVLTLLSLAATPVVLAVSGSNAGPTLVNCFIIVAVANGVGIVGLAASGLLRALQRPVFSGAITMTSDVLSIVASIAMLYAGHRLYSLAAGHAARSLFLAVTAFAGCLWLCRRRLAITPRFSIRDTRSMFATSYYQFFTSVAQRVQSKADVFFVGLLLGPHAAALYGLTARAAETVQMLAAQVVASVDASLAHLHGAGDEARFREVLRIALVSTAFAGALGMTGVAAWNESFVALWVGPALFAGQTTSLLLAAVGMLTIVGSVPYVGLIARGDFRGLSRAYLASVLLHIPLLVVLAPLGVWGAAFAALVAAVFRTGMLCNALRKSMRQGAVALWRAMLLVLAVTLPAAAAALLALVLIPLASGWGEFAGAVLGFSLVVAVATWLTNRQLFQQLTRELHLSVGALRSR